MVQFLTTIIEWLAVMAFSLAGIEFTPAEGCATAGAAYFRADAIYFTPVDFTPADADGFTYLIEADGDCASPASLLQIQDTPTLLDLNKPIDS